MLGTTFRTLVHWLAGARSTFLVSDVGTRYVQRTLAIDLEVRPAEPIGLAHALDELGLPASRCRWSSQHGHVAPAQEGGRSRGGDGDGGPSLFGWGRMQRAASPVQARSLGTLPNLSGPP